MWVSPFDLSRISEASSSSCRGAGSRVKEIKLSCSANTGWFLANGITKIGLFNLKIL